jgi:CRISPR-associated protein Csc3
MTEKTATQDTLDSILGNVRGEREQTETATGSTEEVILEEYRTEIDPRLVDAGWSFEAAKSVEFGKTDQSLLNHVRNGVFALAQLNEAVRQLGGYTLDEADLRGAIALFTIHDLHKLDRKRDADPHSRFDIPQEEVDQYIEQFKLGDFAPDLSSRDFRACTVDHHNDWKANHDRSTRRFDELRPFIRIADAFASCDRPETATGDSVQAAVDHAYPGKDFELRQHSLDDVKGLLTNLVNGAIGERLGDEGYQQLLIYQDGCVYITHQETSRPDVDEGFVRDTLERLQQSIGEGHRAYSSPTELNSNLTTRSQGFYGINDQDFFYAGAETVLAAVVQTGVGDMDPDTEPTESMADSMAALEQHLPFDIERTRRPVGLARLVYTVKRAFIDPVIDTSDSNKSSLEATCNMFGVSEAVESGLHDAVNDDDLSLTAGGKWDYSYGVGQALLDEGMTGTIDLTERVQDGLSEIDDNWVEIVEDIHAGNIRTELTAYLSDIVSIDGRPLPESEETLSDPFEEYHGTRRGKTCVLCNRGTTSTRKSDIQAPKSLTTLQAGYSNHVPVDAGKPDELLACLPCQIELSLRETGASRREGGRLFMHIVPDYYYTPLSWRSYSNILEQFSGESRIELGRLAEAVLWLTGDIEDDDIEGFDAAFFEQDSGRQMAETLDQGFDPSNQYGARTLSYFKPKDNDTEFQFFGVYVALAVAAYAGLRVYVSESPIPDVRGREFQAFARIGGGFTQVHDFYGTGVPLSTLQGRLRAASALIRLGYGTERNDALFAKFLRVTRNQMLPGSHLLKRIAQADDSRDARYLLEEARVLDQEAGIETPTDNTSTTYE